MISTRIRELAEQIQPLFDESAARALDELWGALPLAPGSLGRLEMFARHVAMVRGASLPAAERLGLFVFCGEHGITKEHSGDAASATRQQVAGLLRGDSAVALLARRYLVDITVVDCGLSGEPEQGTHVYRICEGARSFLLGSALTEAELNSALEVGVSMAVDAARRFDIVAIAQLGAGGNVGASAVLAALTGRTAADATCLYDAPGPESATQRRNDVSAGLARHQNEIVSPLATVQCFGGAELAMMIGFLLSAADSRLPVFADGFSGAVAALVARATAADTLDAVLFPGASPAPAFYLALQTLAVEPLLEIGASAGSGFHSVIAMRLVADTLATASALMRNSALGG